MIKFNKENELLCPICECNFCHPMEVKVYPVKGDTEYRIDKNGINIGNSDASDHQRGISIILTFICEEHHIFDVDFSFCKGITYINTETAALIPSRAYFIKMLYETFWRD